MALVVDDRARRHAFDAALNGHTGLDVVGAFAEDGAVAELVALCPAVVVLDRPCAISDVAGLVDELVSQPWAPQVVVAGVDDVDTAVAVLMAGANGVLPGAADAQTVLDAVLAVTQDEAVVPPPVIGALVRRLRHLPAPS